MVDEKIVQGALGAFLANPSWREIYEDAPSETCRRWWALSFARSKLAEKGCEKSAEVCFEEERKVEELLVLDDWKYLYLTVGNNPLKTKCADMIRKLDAEKYNGE